MPKPGDVVAGKYHVDQLLGEGGMGAVFAATHRFTGKQVALKWMLPELARDEDAVQRFMREANAAGRISHPNVVDVYDVGQHEDSFFLVMELLRGEPLTTALARQDLTVREVLDLMVRAMRGVSAAHRQGVVHRDLKPDNIFLAYEEDGVRREPKVLDFGISKVDKEGHGPINPRLTRTGAVVGTPYYMSPEQIRGSDNLDKRADIYAFGVILYEALTGQVPFMAETYGALVLEIATGTPRLPSDVMPGIPLELSRVVLKAMARNAVDRYPDIESLIHAIEPFLQVELPAHDQVGAPRTYSSAPSGPRSTSSNVTSTPFVAEPPPYEDPRLRSSSGKNALLFVLGALFAVVAVWFVVTRSRTPDAPLVNPVPETAVAPSPSAPQTTTSAASAGSAPSVTAANPPSSVPGAAPGRGSAVGHTPSVPSQPPTAAEVNGAPAEPGASAAMGDGTGDGTGDGRGARRWRPRTRNEVEVPAPGPVMVQPVEPPPPIVIHPAPVEPPRERPQPTRRARSGTLSADEF